MHSTLTCVAAALVVVLALCAQAHGDANVATAAVGSSGSASAMKVVDRPSRAELDAASSQEEGQDFWNCQAVTSDRLVYNRIYQASNTFDAVLNRLAPRHGFTIARSGRHDFFITERGGAHLRKRIAQGILAGDFSDEEAFQVTVVQANKTDDSAPASVADEEETAPVIVYDEHAAFMDFAEFGLPSPAYMTVVRNPVMRFAAQYNFDSRVVRVRSPQRFPCTWDSSLDQCLTKLRTGACATPEPCGYRNFMTHFFCGNGRPCNDPSSPAALAQALHNMQYKYAAVGVAEEPYLSAFVMSKVMPSVWKHADTAQGNVPPLTASGVDGLSKENRAFAAELNSNDLKLYNAAKELIRRRAAACQE